MQDVPTVQWIATSNMWGQTRITPVLVECFPTEIQWYDQTPHKHKKYWDSTSCPDLGSILFCQFLDSTQFYLINSNTINKLINSTSKSNNSNSNRYSIIFVWIAHKKSINFIYFHPLIYTFSYNTLLKCVTFLIWYASWIWYDIRMANSSFCSDISMTEHKLKEPIMTD